MIDRSYIGLSLPAHSVEIELGRLRQFARAIGETNPLYTDLSVARGGGYRSVPIPPTFLFCLEMEKPDPFDYLRKIGVDLGKMLHGEQSFRFFCPVCVGETITFQSTVTDIYDKKDGLLEFVVRDTEVTNQDNAQVAEMRTVMVVRNA